MRRLLCAALLASIEFIEPSPASEPARDVSRCDRVAAVPKSVLAPDLVRHGLRLQAEGCKKQAHVLFQRGIYAPGGVEYQAWALRTLADLMVTEQPDLSEAESLLLQARQRSQHYAWMHAEAWVRYRQGRFEEAAEILEELVSGRLHHTAWPWVMFYDDLGDSYAALGRHEEARANWRQALRISADLNRPANPPELPWDRPAVERKLGDQ
jgi:tetratricopeptide (TPR) repeat protein